MVTAKDFLPLGIVLALGPTCKSSFAQDVVDAIQAWQGGPLGQPVVVMKDGVRCEYSQTASTGQTAGRLSVGFTALGCRPSGAKFEFSPSEIRIHKQGPVCVFECAENRPCLEADDRRAASATLYEARTGSCDALAAAVQRIANRAQTPKTPESSRVATTPAGQTINLRLQGTYCDGRGSEDPRRISVLYSLPDSEEEAAKFEDPQTLSSFTKHAAKLAEEYCAGQPDDPTMTLLHGPPAYPSRVRVVVGTVWTDKNRYEANVEIASAEATVIHNGVHIWRNQLAKWKAEREQETRRKEAARKEQEAKEAAERKRQEELPKKLKAALAACGGSPKITGGPWFSSTYKRAALDNAAGLALNSSQIRQEMSRLTAAPDPNPLRQLENIGDDIANSMDTMGKPFVCVREVRYIGPAVNPFGGNAARALFIGYSTRSKDYEPVSYTHDFPY